jgi:DNA invertase Pin-like site-specific DNA recombinase
VLLEKTESNQGPKNRPTTPAGKLMFQVTGAFAEFERSMIRQRINAGLKRAVEQGKQLGRPKIGPALEKRRLINDQRSLA